MTHKSQKTRKCIYSNKYKFQWKGNKEQYKINVKVHRNLKEADHSLTEADDTPTAVSDAKVKIADGIYIELIKKRQKLIKMVDSSPLGWRW